LCVAMPLLDFVKTWWLAFAYLAKKGSISELKRSGSLVPLALCFFPAPARLSYSAAPRFVSSQAHALAGLFFIGSQQAEQRARAPALASFRDASSPSCPQFQRHQRGLRQRRVPRWLHPLLTAAATFRRTMTPTSIRDRLVSSACWVCDAQWHCT